MIKKILIILIILIICISIFIIYIHRSFAITNHKIVKEIMKNDIDNIDIYIFSISKNEEFKISEEDKTRFIELLSVLKVKKTYDIINGVSRTFRIKYNGLINTIGISNSIISIGNDNYTITNGSINEFEQLYYKYTGIKYN